MAGRTTRGRGPLAQMAALAHEAGDIAAFGGRAVSALRGIPGDLSEVLRQLSILIRGSTLIIAALCFLIGFALIEFGYYFLRAISATDYLGLVSGVITARGTAPLMFSYVFAAKVGCGMVAELGAMKVSQETDAYESEGVDPMRYLVATRLTAALLFVPLAGVVALLANTLGDYFAGIVVLDGLSPAAFFQYHWGVQSMADQFLSLLCMAISATVIVIVSCYYGLQARGGPVGVGQACARSLVVNLVLVHFIVPVFLAIAYGSDPRLPIGG